MASFFLLGLQGRGHPHPHFQLLGVAGISGSVALLPSPKPVVAESPSAASLLHVAALDPLDDQDHLRSPGQLMGNLNSVCKLNSLCQVT